MASSCPATTTELVLNLDGTGMNRSGVSGSNLDGVTLPPIPASSSSSTTSSAVLSAASFPSSDGKQVKAVKRKTKIPNKQKKHHQELIQLSSTGIQMLNHYLLQYQVQQNKSTRTTLQDPTQVATFVRENIAQLKERRQKLKQQVVAMQGQSAETTESQLRKTNQQLLQQIKQIHQFMLQVNQQERQLPLTESSASSTIPPWQRNSLGVGPAIDAKILASSRSPSDEANEVPVDAATNTAADHCNQLLLSPITLDPEADSNHEEALFFACTGGKEELVELLLSKGTGTEHRDKKGLTSLMLAASAGHEKVVEVLLNHGANIEAQDEKTKDTPLALACSGGHYKVVELLLKRGANKENHNLDDYTPLTLAASEGHVDIIKLLLSNAAEINSRTNSKQGLSPLMTAAKNGHVEAVRILLEMGSDINANFEIDGYTALTLACYYGKHEVAQLLLEKKANVEQRTEQGFTPLQLSAFMGNAEVGRVLLDYGADANAPPNPFSRDTALTFASEKGLVQLVEMLLKRGALVNVKNKQGSSALWLAAVGGHLQVVELLYKAKADIDLKNNREVSCLMAAFRNGHVQLVEWMVKRVTQFPSDEEVSRIITTTIDNDLLPKYHLCQDIIGAARDRQATEANKKAAHLLKELDMEKNREDLKRAAAAKKREKKKQKKKEKRRAESGDIDNDLQDQDNDNDDMDGKSYTMSTTADPAPTLSNNKKVEDGKFEKSRKNSGREPVTEDVIPTEIKPSTRKNRTKLEIKLNPTKKSTLPPHVESNVKMDGSRQLEGPKKPIKKEEEWKEVVRHRPLSSQENSGSTAESTAGTTKKNLPSDQSSVTLSIIHSSERSKRVTVPSNAIGRVVGKAGCHIIAIREISGALVEIDKPRKRQNHCTVLIKGMPEDISQAQQLITVLLNEPENKFYELLTEFKAGQASSNQACTSLKGTTITGSDSQSKGTIAATIPVITSASIPIKARQNPQNPVVSALLTSAVKMGDKLSDPTTPQPSSKTNASVPNSLPLVETSVAGISALTSRPNSTRPDQDLPINHPFTKAAGTSMWDTNERAVNVVDPAKAQGYQENLHLLTSPPRGGSPTLVNTIPNQPLIPVGNCYSPPPLLQKWIPEPGMKRKNPPTSTDSLDSVDASASTLRKTRKGPHKKTQHHLSQFDDGSIPILNEMSPQGNEQMELPRQTFSLAPGVGRPSKGRHQQSELECPPMLGGGTSSLSITRSSVAPPGFGTGLGQGVMNRKSDHPPNQLGLLDVSTKYRCALAATNTICRVCYDSIRGTSFRCVLCEDYNMCCLCVTSGKHPQHPVVRTMASTVDRDTVNVPAFVTSLKEDTSLVEKLMAKIAEQDVKIKEQDAEMKYLVSARSEAVALLSRPFVRT